MRRALRISLDSQASEADTDRVPRPSRTPPPPPPPPPPPGRRPLTQPVCLGRRQATGHPVWPLGLPESRSSEKLTSRSSPLGLGTQVHLHILAATPEAARNLAFLCPPLPGGD